MSMLAPPAYAEAIVDKLNKAAVTALAKPAVRDQLATAGRGSGDGQPRAFPPVS